MSARGDEQAYPESHPDCPNPSRGMTIRERAAIELRVPDSGDALIDNMIRNANRRDAAMAAMQGMLANPDISLDASEKGFSPADVRFSIAESACKMADKQLTALGKKPEVKS